MFLPTSCLYLGTSNRLLPLLVGSYDSCSWFGLIKVRPIPCQSDRSFSWKMGWPSSARLRITSIFSADPAGASVPTNMACATSSSIGVLPYLRTYSNRSLVMLSLSWWGWRCRYVACFSFSSSPSPNRHQVSNPLFSGNHFSSPIFPILGIYTAQFGIAGSKFKPLIVG